MEPSVCREVAWAELTARVTPVEAVRSGMRGKKEKDRSCLQMRRLLFLLHRKLRSLCSKTLRGITFHFCNVRKRNESQSNGSPGAPLVQYSHNAGGMKR